MAFAPHAKTRRAGATLGGKMRNDGVLRAALLADPGGPIAEGVRPVPGVAIRLTVAR